MGFWSDAFDSLGDNLTLVGKVAEDVVGNLNPLSEQYATGDARNTAAEAERQNAAREGRAFDEKRAESSGKGGLTVVKDATKETIANVAKKTGETVDGAGKVAGGALDLFTNPYVLAGIGAVVLAILVAPYAAPVVAKVLK